MVTTFHEAAHRPFQEFAELIPQAFHALKIPLPDRVSTEVLTPDVTELAPVERRVDSVIRVRTEPEAASSEEFILLIESQTRRKRGKPASWAYYVSYCLEKYKLPVVLLVTAKDRATSTWAKGPFRLDGVSGFSSLVLHPLVLSPDNVPLYSDPEEIRQNMGMAVLSAILHGSGPHARTILKPLAAALGTLDQQTAARAGDLVENGLEDPETRKYWRMLMNETWFTPGSGSLIEETFLAGEAQGEAKGEARFVLRVLDSRGVPVDDESRERIMQCTDTGQLEQWLDRALVATSLDEVLGT
jgi:hypothetical protein